MHCQRKKDVYCGFTDFDGAFFRNWVYRDFLLFYTHFFIEYNEKRSPVGIY